MELKLLASWVVRELSSGDFVVDLGRRSIGANGTKTVRRSTWAAPVLIVRKLGALAVGVRVEESRHGAFQVRTSRFDIVGARRAWCLSKRRRNHGGCDGNHRKKFRRDHCHVAFEIGG